MLIQKKVGIRAQTPFKGVKELINKEKIAEPLSKGLIRQGFGLTVFKDGTVRFDATNSPLTHFKPKWIGTTIEKLKELGYTHDKNDEPLSNPNQIVELRMQDIIITPHICWNSWTNNWLYKHTCLFCNSKLAFCKKTRCRW
jgi:DNA polymerase II large subunit